MNNWTHRNLYSETYTNPMNLNQAKRIPIPDYLDRYGHNPKNTRLGGRELWYHSPIRDGDSNPSFKVDVIKNVWYDYGLSQGGTIVDLVCELTSCNVKEALWHLDHTGLYSPALPKPATEKPGTQKSRTIAESGKSGAGEKKNKVAFELIDKGPLNHPALLQYLDERGINPEIAKEYLSQIDFKHPERHGKYFALGYPAGDGFEARNPLFKGFIGIGKAETCHEGTNSAKLCIFEAVMDFLTYLTVKGQKTPEHDCLILNSTAFAKHALPYIQAKPYTEIQLFLDNDDAGSRATQIITESTQSIPCTDMRFHYASFDDLNAWHTQSKL